ncbi:armadillo-type protein [Mycena rebaudengoi]|nr:armadillo-type protein [Mycena rebaudengoi]
MPPLHRFPTPQSLHSYWRYNFPPYTCQATVEVPISPTGFRNRYKIPFLAVVKGNPGYTRMVSRNWRAKDISISTKIMVLDELGRRAYSEVEAQAIVRENIHYLLICLVHSTFPGILEAACATLGTLSASKCGSDAILETNSCNHLVSLSWHSNPAVQKQAIYALSNIARSSADGARAVADTKAGILAVHYWEIFRDMQTYSTLHKNPGVAKQAIYALSYVDGWAVKVKGTLSKATSIAVRMLESEDTEILECTCRMLLNILRQRDLLEIVAAESKLHLRLIALSEHAQTSVQSKALCVLARINEASTVGPTAAARGDRGWAVRLLASPISSIIIVVCQILGNMARRDALNLNAHPVRSAPEVQLLSLLGHPVSAVQTAAFDALCQISGESDRLRATTDILLDLLDSLDSVVVLSTCQTLLKIARDVELTELVIEPACFARVLSLLDHSNLTIKHEVESLIVVLCQSPLGIRALTVFVEEGFRNWGASLTRFRATCRTLGNLAQLAPLRPITAEIMPWADLAKLLRQNDEFRAVALYPLYHILGCQGKCTLPTIVSALLESDNIRLVGWSCLILGDLAYDERNHKDIVNTTCCLRLQHFARNVVHRKTFIRIMYAMEQISTSQIGARVLVKVNALASFANLLKSTDPLVPLQTLCRVFNNLVSNGSLNPVALERAPFDGIISLLSHEDPLVQAEAVSTLHSILVFNEDTIPQLVSRDFLNAEMLSVFPALLQSEDPEVVEHACLILGRIAQCDKLRAAVLESPSCELLLRVGVTLFEPLSSQKSGGHEMYP